MELKLKSYTEAVDKRLVQYLKGKPCPDEIIYEAMNYSVFAGGKRIRPVLCMAACELFSGSITEALPFAAALEMIHTYSLIHDDLPAMDDDDLRRGKPTCHIRFGENVAILAGDALLNRAFEVIFEALSGEDIERKILAGRTIAENAGVGGMIGGQVVDVIFEGKVLDSSLLSYIHSKKTVALITASLKSGAMIGGAGDAGIKDIGEFAYNLGLAFQIKDDILDSIGDESIMGKRANNDASHNKTTFVSLYGVNGAEELAGQHTAYALGCLDKIKGDVSFLKWIAHKLLERNK